MASDLTDGGRRFCQELEEALHEAFPERHVHVVPKHETPKVSMVDMHTPSTFTLELLCSNPTLGGVYLERCIDVSGEEYLLKWGNRRQRMDELQKLVAVLLQQAT
jgi:hypothetical protein